MKKIIILATTALLLFCYACSKFNKLPDNNPTEDPSYIFGKLQLTDVQTQNVTAKPLASKTVYLCLAEEYDGLNFLYSNTTDAEGYFKFTGLNKTKNYIVFYKETISGVIFSAKSEILTGPQPKYALQAGLAGGQTGVLATVQDAQGNPIKGATVCFGISPFPASIGVCDGMNYSSAATDELGHGSVFNVSPNTYYALAKISINNVVYTDKVTVPVTAGSLATPIFKVNTPTSPVISTSLTLQLTDVSGVPLPSGHYCLFTSRTLFRRDTCEVSNYSVNVDATGKGTITNIPAAYYYILGELALKKSKLLGHDSLLLGNTPFNLIMKLK
jgi:hypothetical protein